MTDVYQMVTDRILEHLSQGTIPWRCPWQMNSCGCISYSTGKPYSLLNQLLLGGRTGEYITFNQAKASGGNVRKGEKSRFVVFWKLLEVKDKDTDEITIIPILKYYNVFHIDQCKNINPRWRISEVDNTEPGNNLLPDDKAEQVILDYIDRSGVSFKPCRSDRAYYSPSTDTIVVPELSQYSEIGEYYSSAFHEIVHLTGATKRLNRLRGDAAYQGYHETYSTEELVAEIGLAFLCNHCGVETADSFRNSTAYINGWVKALRSDKRLIVSAAGKAEKAVNYILGKEGTDDDAESREA